MKTICYSRRIKSLVQNLSNVNGSRLQRDVHFGDIIVSLRTGIQWIFLGSAWTRFLNRIFYISWKISHRHSYKRFWKTWYYFHSTHLALLHPFRSIRENIFSKFFQNNFQSFFFKIKLRVLLKSDLSILSPLRSKFHAAYEFGIPFNAIDCLPCSSKNFPSERILTRLLFMGNICHRDMISLIENNTVVQTFHLFNFNDGHESFITNSQRFEGDNSFMRMRKDGNTRYLEGNSRKNLKLII